MAPIWSVYGHVYQTYKNIFVPFYDGGESLFDCEFKYIPTTIKKMALFPLVEIRSTRVDKQSCTSVLNPHTQWTLIRESAFLVEGQRMFKGGLAWNYKLVVDVAARLYNQRVVGKFTLQSQGFHLHKLRLIHWGWDDCEDAQFDKVSCTCQGSKEWFINSLFFLRFFFFFLDEW